MGDEHDNDESISLNRFSMTMGMCKGQTLISENRHPPLAQRLWNMIVREFDKLILNETFIE